MLAGASTPLPKTLEELLPPDLAGAIDGLDVLSRKVLSGKLPGERRSKRRGRSVEFDDFRQYSPGDDPRTIDWNIVARLDRLVVKLFREEEDLGLYVIVDVSASMNAGTPNKLAFAARTAMALAYVALVNQNRLTIATVGGSSGLNRMMPLRGRAAVHRVGAFLLEQMSGATKNPSRENEPGKAFASQMRAIASEGSLRGVLVLLSDFLFDGEAGLGFLTPAIASGGLDAYALQTLAPGELDPSSEVERGLIGDLQLEDVETAKTLAVTVSPESIARYRAVLTEKIALLHAGCAARGVAHMVVNTSVPVRDLLINTLRRTGALA